MHYFNVLCAGCKICLFFLFFLISPTFTVFGNDSPQFIVMRGQYLVISLSTVTFTVCIAIFVYSVVSEKKVRKIFKDFCFFVLGTYKDIFIIPELGKF